MSDLLGFNVQDKVSGLKGVAVAVYETAFRSPQYMVQPPAKEDNIFPDAVFVDLNDVVQVGSERCSYREPPIYTIGLSQTVEDTATEFQGKTIGRLTTKDGCVNFEVIGKAGKDGKQAQPVSIPMQRLKLVPVKAGILARAQVEQPSQVMQEVGNGAPRRRAGRSDIRG